ncbi:MAG: YggT family protein [Anaerolineales bacterium]
MDLIVNIVGLVYWLILIVVLADVFVSWVLDPFHPVRSFLDSIVQPMLDPIRRLLPPASGIDFSPFVFLIVLQLARTLIIGVLRAI